MLKSIRFMSIKTTNAKPLSRRFHRVKAGQLPLLILQTILPRTFSWLSGSGGGCKSDRQAQQIVSKCLTFLKFCCEDEEELTFDIVDFNLCSPYLLFKFVDTMQDVWNLGHVGRIGYLDAIAELVDYRKVNGASESVLRGLASTEIYFKKVRKTVSQNDAVAVDQ